MFRNCGCSSNTNQDSNPTDELDLTNEIYQDSCNIEENTFDGFTSYLRSVKKYFESVNLEYFKIKKLISKLPGSYTDSGTLKCRLLSKLNDSIFIGNFDTVKDEIVNSVYSKQDEIVAIKIKYS